MTPEIAALTTAVARRIVDAALGAPRSPGPRRPIAIAVGDAGANPLVMLREEDAPPLLAHIAMAKAFTCAAYGRPSKLVMEWADASPNWFQGIGHVAASRMGMPLTGSLGGVIIRDADGVLLGAVGVAGEAGEVDQAISVAGIEAAGLVAETG